MARGLFESINGYNQIALYAGLGAGYENEYEGAGRTIRKIRIANDINLEWGAGRTIRKIKIVNDINLK